LKQVLDRVSTKPPELPRPPLAALEHQVRTLLKLPKDTQQGWQQRLQKVKQEVSKVTKAELVREKKQGEPRKAPATGREKEATAAQKEPTTNLVEISSKLVDAPTTGPEAIAAALDKIDLDQVEQTALSDIRSGKKTRRPNAVKLLGYVQGFRRSNLHPRDLVISRVPVIPPPFRPYAVAGDTFVPGDANELYRDLINIKGVHQDLEQKVGPAGAAANRLHVYDAVKALYGFGEPVSPKTRERGVSGFLKKITGSSPKFSFVQSKLLAHDQDFVGRSVIGVDPELHMDQIGVPDEMLWPMYSPYIQRRLVRSGMRLEDAVQAVKDRSPQAGAMLDDELQERPVMYSRAPSWHKFSTLGGWVKRVPGNTIMINPLVTTGMNADFDGDAINVHVPALDASVDDVKHKLMPSRQLWSIKSPDRVMPVLKQEQVLGLWTAQHRPARATHTFPSEGLALAAIRAGKVRLSDEIKIDGTGGRDKTAG
jgi:DNA-directed RNA polymerase beta' subunit